MSIQKKSLISTLKSAKKANVVKEEATVSNSTASPALRAARAGAKVFAGSRAPKVTAASRAPKVTAASRAPKKTAARIVTRRVQ
jgi:hypothetical protein